MIEGVTFLLISEGLGLDSDLLSRKTKPLGEFVNQRRESNMLTSRILPRVWPLKLHLLSHRHGVLDDGANKETLKGMNRSAYLGAWTPPTLIPPRSLPNILT